jgi:hypothetical protein
MARCQPGKSKKADQLSLDANHFPQALVTLVEEKWWLYVFYAIQVGWRWEEGKYPFFEEGDYYWFYDQFRYKRHEIKVE